MAPSPKRTAFASITYHVQQWINLVLYNSIYQNLILLYLYRLFKFIYGLVGNSTELSRICGATRYSTPLDSLWDEHGNVTSSLVTDKQIGTIAYTNAAIVAHGHAQDSNAGARGRRRGSVANSLVTTATAAAAAAVPRTSTDSVSSTQSTLESGSDVEKQHPLKGSPASGMSSCATVVESEEVVLSENKAGQLKRRTKRREHSTSSAGSHTSDAAAARPAPAAPLMDLRQSRSAAEMVYRIDRCILFSKQLTAERRELEAADCDPVQITMQILRKKQFPEGGDPNTPAAKKLQYALDRVASTHQLAREINQRIHTKYDSTNPTHERKLLLLWDLLCPQEKLSARYTKQWTEIGFQGKDPATDFRGMGMLGLDDLVYYAKYYPISSKHALKCSHDDVSWYSFAIVGINITAFAVQTLRTRQLQYYLFLNGTDRSVYHELYCYLFHRFNGYWSALDPKPSIMDFERVFADFKIMMEKQLARRKLMMLRFDTKEVLGSGGYPIAHQYRRHPHIQEERFEAEAIELETKKAV
ncbi:hypothetical protein BGZ70_000498 [Mortierella alpina]|uniref:ELMO domain-containing protein n=1 Tax=Mortierella alpina TaxID=64518 RepID=A0A9P6IXV6_MORAP|nr:hypothetical protein BGZ70_000498 [Mortierella alpina]